MHPCYSSDLAHSPRTASNRTLIGTDVPVFQTEDLPLDKGPIISPKPRTCLSHVCRESTVSDVQQDRKASRWPDYALLVCYYLSSALGLYTPGDTPSGPVWIQDSGHEYIEFDPFELPKLVSGGDASPPGDLRVAVLEHAGFHDGE